MNWLYSFIGLASVADVLIGGYVFFKNPTKPLNRVFFVFSFGMSLIGVSMILLFNTHNIIFDRLLFLGGYLMIFGLVLLSIKFPKDEPIRPATWFAFLPLVILAALTPAGFLVKEVIFRPDGILEPVNGPGIHIFAIVIFGYVAMSVVEFYKKYKNLAGQDRLQMQYLILGAFIFVLSTLIFNVLLPALGFFELNFVGPISSISFVFFVAYAIIRHNLFDIRTVLQRGLIYLTLFALIIALYLVLIFTVNFWLNDLFGQSQSMFLVVGLITVLIGIFTTPVLERHLRHATDKFFFKDRYKYPQALRKLSEVLNQNLETSQMIAKISRTLQEILKAKIVRVNLLKSFGPNFSFPDKPIKNNDLQGVSIPMYLGQKPFGVIVLGPKKSDEIYREEDIDLLTTFSYQAAVALEKARLFEELKQYSERLEERVSERTKELEDLQDNQNQMMIDISHRLQTPLAAIKSEIDFLKRKSSFPKHLRAFENSIDGISKFIYDLLNLARLGMNKGEADKVQVDLSALLNGLVEYFAVMATDGNIRLTSEIVPGITVMGNKDQLEELITNIVSNAFKYSGHKREGKVFISLKKTETQITLEIVDNGSGIDSEDLKNIFKRYYRGKSTREDMPSGTGLGLAIAKRIAENHGGNIIIESELEQGTKVIVLLSTAEN